MRLRPGDIVRYRILTGLFRGQTGVCRIERFEKVPEGHRVGSPAFRPGDTLVFFSPRRPGGDFWPIMRFGPGQVEFAPEGAVRRLSFTVRKEALAVNLAIEVQSFFAPGEWRPVEFEIFKRIMRTEDVSEFLAALEAGECILSPMMTFKFRAVPQQIKSESGRS